MIQQNWMNETKVVYVLGLDYHVRESIHWTDAVTNILKGKFTPFMVHPTKRVRSAGGIDMAWPLIVRLNYWVDIPFSEPVDLDSRANNHQILRRDGRTCGYCGEYADTVDHIKPESRCKRDGDPHNGWTWGNLVAACRDCNSTKDDRTPEEAGMKLLWTPHVRNVGDFPHVQAVVWKVLETGEGYVLETTDVEGILKNDGRKKFR